MNRQQLQELVKSSLMLPSLALHICTSERAAWEVRPCGTTGTLEVPSLYLSLTSFSSFLTSYLSEVAVVSLLAFLVPLRTCRPPVPNLACTCKGEFQLNFDIFLSPRCRYLTLVNIHRCLCACVYVCKRGVGEGLMVTVEGSDERQVSCTGLPTNTCSILPQIPWFTLSAIFSSRARTGWFTGQVACWEGEDKMFLITAKKV